MDLLTPRKRKRRSQSTIRRLLAGTTALVFLAGLAPALQAGMGAHSHMTDQEIADAVEDEILFDQAVSHNDINVRVKDGIAMLTGTTDNILTRDRAQALAETVRGVAAVVNRIRVEPPVNRKDSEIRQDAEAALLANPATDSFEVDAHVRGRRVSLTGTVDSWQEKTLAESVVKGVRGVVDVDNRIDVDYKMKRSDSEILHDIEESLKWSTLVDHELIDVEVNDGHVRLTGIIGSAAEKTNAAYKAWVAGVEDVDSSSLRVRDWARDEDQRQRRYVPTADEDIEQAIHQAFRHDPRVLTLSKEIRVESENGIVTLRGAVASLKARRAAEQDARNTMGVIDVSNRLKVHPYEIADENILSHLNRAIRQDPYLDDHEIHMSVREGVVDLTGSVDTYFEKGHADDLSSRMLGVKNVHNHLRVEYDRDPLAYDPFISDWYPYGFDWYDYQPYATFSSDRDIRKQIHTQLWWSPFVDADEVSISVDEGRVTLSGVVDTWFEKRAATENAYEGGAVWVKNELDVEQDLQGR